MKIYNHFKNKAEEKISQEFRLKYIDETIKYLIEKLNRNEVISKKHKKILASAMTGCTTISAFFSLVVIPVAITSSPTELKVCAVIAWIKKCKSIIKKNKKSMIK